jgi:hypothetical protein
LKTLKKISDKVAGKFKRARSTKEVQVRDRKGRREYLCDAKTREMIRELNHYFDTKMRAREMILSSLHLCLLV